MAQGEQTGFDRLWSRAQLYTGDSESAVQSIALTGRFQVDQAYVDSGDQDFSDVDLRRFRFGVKMGFLDNFTFHAEGEFDPNGGSINYKRLTDTYLAWSPSESLELTVGKHGAAFTMDGQTSSKELLTIDRSNLTNNIWFTEEYVPGISLNGSRGKFVYDVGVFSSGEKGRGLGSPNGNRFVLATVGRDLTDRFSASKALLRVNYVDNDPGPSNSYTRPLENVVSINFDFEKDRWGVRSDVSTATGYLGQSDLSGIMVMPFFNLGNGLQLVTRYTYLQSDDPNGVRFGRYEREVASGMGDEYSEIYMGVNYYLYGHKLKLQTGLQYADMNDTAADGGAYTGWGWTTGFRLSW